MNRRGFLSGILAAAAAPAFVRYGSLMVPRAPRWSFTSTDLAFGVEEFADRMLRPMAQKLGDVLTVREAPLYAEQSILTIGAITREALRLLEDQVTFSAKLPAVWSFDPEARQLSGRASSDQALLAVRRPLHRPA